MAEIRRGFAGDPGSSERLPWLEPVEDEDDYGEGGGGMRLAVIGVAVLVALALAIGGFVAIRHWRSARSDIGGVIQAEPGPYKVRPDDPGGLAVDRSAIVAEETGTGRDIDAPLSTVLPEEPVIGPGSKRRELETRPAPTPIPAPTAVGMPMPAPAAPKVIEKQTAVIAPRADAPAPAEGGGTIQLGALGSDAKAKAAWKALSKRFAFLQPMTMTITQVTIGDSTYYRLRASGGGDAGRLCARLKLAGERCVVVN